MRIEEAIGGGGIRNWWRGYLGLVEGVFGIGGGVFGNGGGGIWEQLVEGVFGDGGGGIWNLPLDLEFLPQDLA